MYKVDRDQSPKYISDLVSTVAATRLTTVYQGSEMFQDDY